MGRVVLSVRVHRRLLTRGPDRLSPVCAELGGKIGDARAIYQQIAARYSQDKRALQDFGPEVAQLACTVYQRNDGRTRIKREINAAPGSLLDEEKSYREWRGAGTAD